MILTAILAALLIYSVNQIHLYVELGIPGINLTNLIFGAALVFLAVSQRGAAPPKPMLGGALRLYFAAIALATVIGMLVRPQSPMEDLTYLKTLLFYPLYYFLFYYGVRDLKSARRLILLVFVIALVAALEAVKEGMSYGIGAYAETQRASGPFGFDYRNANRAGVFYAMFIPLFAAPAFFLKGQPLWRMVALGGVLVLAAAILFTYSRQSYFIGLLVLALLAIRRSTVIAVVCAIGFAMSIPFLPSGVFERVQETQQVGEYGEEELDVSTASRFEIWAGAVEMWAENPMGIGANRFKGMIGNYSNFPGKDAHNYFVLTMAEAGFFGLFALLWLVFTMWRLGSRLVQTAFDPESRALAHGFRFAVLAMALGNLYGSPFPEGTVMGVFWALAALVERRAQLVQAQATMPKAPPVAVRRRTAPRVPA